MTILFIFLYIIIVVVIFFICYQLLVKRGATNKELERFIDGFTVGMTIALILLIISKFLL